MSTKYDVAAFVWPAYTGDEPRTRLFWPDGMGEWESVRNALPKFEGHNWPRKPMWGYVNEADKYIMEMQINAAYDYGVNVFIYDWYWFDNRPFLENCLNDGYLKARNRNKTKFYLMWANHDVNYIWDKRNSDEDVQDSLERLDDGLIFTGSVNREQFEFIADRLIDKYFCQQNYYTIDDKPVFMIFSLPTLIKGLGGLSETKSALDWFKVRCVEKGLSGLHLQLNIHKVCSEIYDGDRLLTTDELMKYLGFESATNYQMANLVENIYGEYSDIADEAVKSWYRIDSENSAMYFPQVSVGWDNNPRFYNIKKTITGSTPDKFERALCKAKEFIDSHPDNPPLITINSWNEWTEGSYLEPDNINGYKYLEAVRNVFGGE